LPEFLCHFLMYQPEALLISLSRRTVAGGNGDWAISVLGPSPGEFPTFPPSGGINATSLIFSSTAS
jgi:hypothetical protein